MNWWHRFTRKKELERQLESELHFHFDQQVADFIHAGMSLEAAHRAAVLKFGLIEGVKEDCRDVRGTRWVEIVLQDARYALRILRGSPAFTIVALLCLSIGIGANTAIFSVIQALMMRALPVQNPQQLVLLGEGQASGNNDDFGHTEPDLFSWPFYQQLHNDKDTFSDVLAIRSSGTTAHVRLGDAQSAELERAHIQLVSGNYFSLLGVPPSRGRLFTSNDDRTRGGSPVAVIRYGYWESRFARDPGVIGRSVFIGGSVLTIIGVTAPNFFGTVVGLQPDFWIPLSMQQRLQPASDDQFAPLAQYLWLIGRLKPGISMSQARVYTNLRYRQWLSTIAGSAPSEETAKKIERAHVTLTDASRGISRLRREFSRPLQILMALVGLVLLIACANIANLLLARASVRQREIALRVAIGASRRRVFAQLLSESLLLALIGGCLGLLLSIAGIHVLLSVLSSGSTTIPINVTLDSGVLLFTLGLSLLTGLIFGIVPALYLTSLEVGSKLNEGKGLAGSRARNTFGRALVTLQVALAFFLIVGAGLFIDTFKKLEESNLGFQKDRVLLLQLDSDPIRSSGPTALLTLYKRLESRIQALPGVEAASFSEVTFNEGHWRAAVWPEGVIRSEANGKSFNGDHVGAQYFHVLGTRVLMGRGFGPQDTLHSRPVAVVNETFARSLFPDVSPLGRHFSIEQQDSKGFEIVGVVKDARYEKVREHPLGAFFLFNDQNPTLDGYSDLVIRSRQSPELLVGAVRQAVHAENPGIGISSSRTLSEQVDNSLGTERLLAHLTGFFALVALVLACIGLYGVLAYSVAQRRKEIGIRMALGARPSVIITALLAESLTVVGLGLSFGLPAAIGCGRFIQSELYGVTASDPAFLFGSAALLILTALAAGFLPGRKAALLDPLVALRHE
jgi:predicted permease